jgi:hypothetical protein
MALTYTQIAALRDDITSRSVNNPPSNQDETRTLLAYQKLCIMFGYYLVKTAYTGTGTAKGIFAKTDFISFASGHGYTSGLARPTAYLYGSGGTLLSVNINTTGGQITSLAINTAGSGYAPGDPLYVNQTGYTEQAKFTVATVSAGGVPTALTYGITTGTVQEIWWLFYVDAVGKRTPLSRNLSFSNLTFNQSPNEASDFAPTSFYYNNGATNSELVIAPFIKTAGDKLEVWCNVVPPVFSGSSTPTAGFPEQFHEAIAMQAAYDILSAARRRLEAESYRQSQLLPKLREMLAYAMLQNQNHPLLQMLDRQLNSQVVANG